MIGRDTDVSLPPLLGQIPFSLPGSISSRFAGKEDGRPASLFLQCFGQGIAGFGEFYHGTQLAHVAQFAIVQNNAFNRKIKNNKQSRNHQSGQFAPHGEVVDEVHGGALFVWLMPVLSLAMGSAFYRREGVAEGVVSDV